MDVEVFCDAMTRPLDLDELSLPDDFVTARAAARAGVPADSDAIVFMDPSARQPDIDELEALLTEADATTIVAFIDRDAAYAEFQEMWAESDVILESVALLDMPPRFEIIHQGGDITEFDELLDQLRTSDRIFEIVDTRQDISDGPFIAQPVSVFELLVSTWLSPELIVFMDPEATDVDHAATQALLDDDGLTYTAVDKRSSLVEYERMFPNSAVITESEMPSSFRIEYSDTEDLGHIGDRMRDVHGVFEVVATSEPMTDAVRVTSGLLLNNELSRQAINTASNTASPEIAERISVLSSEALRATATLDQFYPVANRLRSEVAKTCGWDTCFCGRSELRQFAQEVIGFD